MNNKNFDKIKTFINRNRIQSIILLIAFLFVTGGVIGSIRHKTSDTAKKTVESFGEENTAASYDKALYNAAPESAPDVSAGMAKRSAVAESKIAPEPSPGVNAPDTGSEFKKLTKNGFIGLKVNDIEVFENELNDIVNSKKGYIYNISQNETERRRNLNATVKVPQNDFDAILNLLKEKGKVINTDVSVSDITMQYSQTENHIKSLKVKEERLNAILMKAEKIEDILAVENQLQQTREDLAFSSESMEILKNQVEYGTINISAYDEKAIIQETPHKENFIVSIFKNAFRFWSDIFETAVSFIVYSIPLIVFLILFIFLRKKMKIRSEKNQGIIFKREDKENNSEG